MKSTQNDFSSVPQEILDRLTRFDMPAVYCESSSEQAINVSGRVIPVYQCEALVLGSGAAGMRAAIGLIRVGKSW